MRYIVGLDLGGTHIVCGLLDLNGHPVVTIKRETEAQHGPDAILERMASMMREVIQERNVAFTDVCVVE